MHKRNTEGFALAYVAIVIAVLTILVTGLTSISLRILMAQEATTERMQSKYAAQGAIELLIAELTTSTVDGILSVKSTDVDLSDLPSNAATRANDAIKFYFNGSKDPVTGLTVTAPVDTLLTRLTDLNNAVDRISIDSNYIVACAVSVDGITIKTEFELTPQISTPSVEVENLNYKEGASPDEIAANPSIAQKMITMYGYQVDSVELEFVSYEIITEGGDAE